jgi:hypothetical protein
MLSLFAESAWKVLVAGLLLGAGLPAVFALGVRLTAVGSGQGDVSSPVGAARPAYRALGLLCFLVAALVVALGITVVVASGFGKVVSFEHVYPTLVPKG